MVNYLKDICGGLPVRYYSANIHNIYIYISVCMYLNQGASTEHTDNVAFSASITPLGKFGIYFFTST